MLLLDGSSPDGGVVVVLQHVAVSGVRIDG